MDADTIDLTEPLEDILRKTTWTAECINDRLSLLVENTTKSQDSTENITLSELLNSCNGISKATDRINLKTLLGQYKRQPAVLDTILISDDDEPDRVNNSEEGIGEADSESITEVEVVEVSDYSNSASYTGSGNQSDDGVSEGAGGAKTSISGKSDNLSRSSSVTSQSKQGQESNEEVKIDQENASDTEETSLSTFNGEFISLPVVGFPNLNCRWDGADVSKSALLGPDEDPLMAESVSDKSSNIWLCEDPLRTELESDPVSKNLFCEDISMTESIYDNASKAPLEDPERTQSVSDNVSKSAFCGDTLMTESIYDNVSKAPLEESERTELVSDNVSKRAFCADTLMTESIYDDVSKSPLCGDTLMTESIYDNVSKAPLEDPERTESVSDNVSKSAFCGDTLITESIYDDVSKSPLCEDTLMTESIDVDVSKGLLEYAEQTESVSDKVSKSLLCKDTLMSLTVCDKVSEIPFCDDILMTESVCDNISKIPVREDTLMTESSIYDQVIQVPLCEISLMTESVSNKIPKIPDGEYELNTDTLCMVSAKLPVENAEIIDSPSVEDSDEAAICSKLISTQMEELSGPNGYEEMCEAKPTEHDSLRLNEFEMSDSSAPGGLISEEHRYTKHINDVKRNLDTPSAVSLPDQNCNVGNHTISETQSVLQSAKQMEEPSKEDKQESALINDQLQCNPDENFKETSKTECGSVEQTSDEETEAPPASNPEEIRKHLLLQLSNLRGRRKMNILQHVQQTLNENTFSSSSSSRKASGDSHHSISETSKLDLISVKCPQPMTAKHESLKADDTQCDNAVSSHEDEDVPNVFNEIRKIIRKPKVLPPASGLIKTTPNLIVANNVVEESKTALVPTSKPQELNADETMSEGPKSVVKECSNNVVRSPFISNTLDEFLIDSKLNVSYVIPKSGAEEGLKQDYSNVVPLISHEAKVKEEESTSRLKVKASYKPKTLAEKRKILERHTRQQESRLKKQKMKTELQKKSYVLFKDKKIFINSKVEGKCIAAVDSTIRRVSSDSSLAARKPSLLTHLYRDRHSLQYKPGPLSKKYLLQSENTEWASELKLLPKVVVDVKPEFGKPVSDNILPNILRQWDGFLTEDQVEFALTALVGQSQSNERIFHFEVGYEKGLDKVLVRKKADEVQIIPSKNDQSCSDSDRDIAGILDDLLKYVEIKEMSSDIIKEDESASSSIEVEASKEAMELLDPMKPLDPIKPKKKCRSIYTKRELLRLNCKVVTMDANVSAEPKKLCSKPHCRLGCVCESLRCETLIGIHCRKLACIFGCLCPKRRNAIINISAPTDSDGAFLSRDAVNRIEDEAKKDLAKEEREFTQTIIYSNDNAIVLGSGHKSRRAARAPKKYTDFFEDDMEKEPTVNKIPTIVPCSVFVEKWDFSDIVPYCLEHDLYNCHCNGLEVSSLLKQAKELRRLRRETSRSSSGIRKKRYEHLFSDNRRDSGSKRGRYKPKSPHINDPGIESGTRSTPSGCARTCPFSGRYRNIAANSSVEATANDFINNITEADLLAIIHRRSEDLLDSQQLKNYLVEDWQKTFGQISTVKDTEQQQQQRSKNKRKQQLEVRQDLMDNLDVKLRKAAVFNTLLARIANPAKKIRKSIAAANQAVRGGKIATCFPGEIIVNDSEWLKKFYSSTTQPSNNYARILPWTALLKGFLAKSINVYCICEMPLRLLLTVGKDISGSNFLNIETFGTKILDAPLRSKYEWLIKQSENVRDIIKWLLSGTLSSKYKPSSLSFLLVETAAEQFEVRGLCTQSAKPNTPEINNAALSEDMSVSDEITEIKHKNMQNKVVSLFITKWNYGLRELVGGGSKNDDAADDMWAELPDVDKVAKWRVVFLRNDFLYLFFKNVGYSIKYGDLAKLTEIAKEERLTLLVRNLQIRRNHDHSLFGLYVTPQHTDRCFIGPYFVGYEEGDIDTLQSINGTLISSESYYKTKGDIDYVCGQWFHERSAHRSQSVLKEKRARQEVTSTSSAAATPIVLEEEVVPLPVITKSLVSSGSKLSKDEKIINHNGLKVIIKNSKPRSPSEFNRYIITNIPNFGYLGAFQRENSSILEVSWPFERKVLQFESADEARDFLQERFNQLLQPVPETFKIQVIVLVSLDLNECQPINSDVLNGHSICGYFGTYNFRGLTDEFCREKLKVTKQYIVSLFAKRAYEFIRQKVKDLAELVGVPSTGDQYNMENILKITQSEVKAQEETRRDFISKTQKLEKSVSEKILKIFSLIKDLPVKDRNIESRILNEILQIRPRHPPVNEVIEITDDDDDAGGDDKRATETKSIDIPPNNIEKAKIREESTRPIESEQQSVLIQPAKTSKMVPPATSVTLMDTVNDDDEITEVIPAEDTIGSWPIITDVRTVVETDDESDENAK